MEESSQDISKRMIGSDEGAGSLGSRFPAIKIRSSFGRESSSIADWGFAI